MQPFIPTSFRFFVPALLLAGAAGCASVEREKVQASAGSPVSAQVPPVALPYDPAAPRFVVVVESIGFGASSILSGASVPGAPGVQQGVLGPLHGGLAGGGLQSGAASHGGHPGSAVANQLVSTLASSPNISILDPSGLTRNADGTYGCRLAPGETGPFILRGAVTEFNETADLSEKKRGFSLGWLGAVFGIAGAVTDKPALGWTGAGVAAANPTYTREKAVRKGMTAVDFQLVDGRNARLLRGYTASGTFVSESSVGGMSLFGIGGGNAEFAASALGQATRAAVNDAALKTLDALKSAPR